MTKNAKSTRFMQRTVTEERRTRARAPGTLLLALVPLLSACLFGTDDEQDAEPVELTINWSVRNAAGDVIACPDRFQTVWITAVPQDDDTPAMGFPFTFQAPCSSGSGSTTVTLFRNGIVRGRYFEEEDRFFDEEAAGLYFVGVRIGDATGEVSRALTYSRFIDLRGGPGSVSADVFVDAGQLLVRWDASVEGAGFVTTCEATGGTDVAIRYRPLADETAPLIEERFPCSHREPEFGLFSSEELGNALTRPAPVGDYFVSAHLLRADGSELATEDVSRSIVDSVTDSDMNTVNDVRAHFEVPF